MKIELKNNRLIFWFEKAKEEKIVNGFLRDAFEDNGFMTDRCFDKNPIPKNYKPLQLGVRILLKKANPNPKEE